MCVHIHTYFSQTQVPLTWNILSSDKWVTIWLRIPHAWEIPICLKIIHTNIQAHLIPTDLPRMRKL